MIQVLKCTFIQYNKHRIPKSIKDSKIHIEPKLQYFENEIRV